jgi:hypothetical protein
MDEPARQRAGELAKTPELAHAQRQRNKVEALFAELKTSDRPRSLAPSETEVRGGAVLSCGCPESQTTGPLPQPTDNTHSGSCFLGEVRTRTRAAAIIAAEKTFRSRPFSTPTGVFTN